MDQSPPVLKISQGKLKGAICKDYDGNNFYSFLGIPYGKPPVDKLRFKAPVPAEPWTGIRDATVEGDRCYARHERTGEIGGSENCLHLNVYTKTLPHESSQLKPVMVYIHGGGFTAGTNSPKLYGAEFLITEDIVLVAMNYRIGIFGFLCLKDPPLEVPGNAGLKDQVLALKWIRDNIAKFNGDPNNVTIFGNSAGAVSASYMMLSPSARGLFHKVILQSGTALSFYGEGNWVAVEIARLMGEEVEGEKEAFEVIKNASMEKLNEVREKMSVEIKANVHRHFGAIIEYPNPTAFITRAPLEIIKSGEYNKVPIMLGYNSREGMLMLGDGPVKNIDPDEHIPWQMGLEQGSRTRDEVCRKLKKFYLEGENKSDLFFDVVLQYKRHWKWRMRKILKKYSSNLLIVGILTDEDSGEDDGGGLIDILPASQLRAQAELPTDGLFVAGIIATVKHHLKNLENPIFLYRVTLEARLNLLKHLMKAEKLPGVCHADELGYLFKSDQTISVEAGSIEEISIRRFVRMWTNFAKYGNPTPDKKHVNIIWKPVEKDKTYFLNIGKVLTLAEDPEKERIAFWKDIFQYSSVTAGLL